MKEKLKNCFRWARFEEVAFGYCLKWLVLTAVTGGVIGSASALLLVSLAWATDYRESHVWIIGVISNSPRADGFTPFATSTTLLG